MTRSSLYFAHAVVALAVAIMLGLGAWQLSRAHWKDSLLARYAGNGALPEMAYPLLLPARDLPLFRKARGTCLDVASLRTAPGTSLDGEPGFAIIADCRTGAEGPGMAVELGWSKNPAARPAFTGGEVHGVIGPDKDRVIRLVVTNPPPGLAASAPPSLSSIPNNHRGYAIQWFLFALAATIIYVVAVRRRLAR